MTIETKEYSEATEKHSPSLSIRVFEGIAWRLAKRSNYIQRRWRAYLTTQRLREAKRGNLVAAASIPGWLSAEEAEALDTFSRKAPSGHFLEIGSFCGRSSVIIGGVMAERGDEQNRLFCCDPFGNVGKAEEKSRVKRWASRNRSSFETFRHNILANDLDRWVVTLAGKSDDVLPMTGHQFGFVFIDGAHAYDNVRQDIELTADRVQQGGYLLFHDATSQAVGRAIEDGLDHKAFKLIEHPAGSIAVFQRVLNGESE